MSEFSESKVLRRVPRLPLKGEIDITYRCNNNCRHCWLRIPLDDLSKQKELTFDEIIEIVDDARSMGCREWGISGGEPMIRPDFADIFEYIISKSSTYCLNTNGTLITPKIARLMKSKGAKLVSIYGATAEVHDHITRNPGSFDAAMRGFAYLKEAGANFTVQIVPMKDNYHQYKDMISLAESLSPRWKLGASWLYLSAYDEEKDQEIIEQRLDPEDIVAINDPIPAYEDEAVSEHDYRHDERNSGIFSDCIASRRDFHIDPYGQMSFCCYIKSPDFRYDLRAGNFKEAWEEFIPSLGIKNTFSEEEYREYMENCGSCELKEYCRWCPVYAYLEHGRYSARIEYLCAEAKEIQRFKEEWRKNNLRYFQIGGITIRVGSDLPMTENTFDVKFKEFEVDGPGEDNASIHHHFSLLDIEGQELGEEVYRRPPWVIYKKGNSWIYLGDSSETSERRIWKVATFSHDHAKGIIYNNGEEKFHKIKWTALTLFPSDQIILARLLSDRQGCYLHSGGVALDGKGLVFVGHSDAGKSTMMTMLKEKAGAKILCDDRIIVRRWPAGFKIHGTWSHGDVPDVSPDSAPLRAVLFLEQAKENRLIPFKNKQDIMGRYLACLIKPLVTVDWWDKMLDLMERITQEVPCYILRFDKSGEVAELLKKL